LAALAKIWAVEDLICGTLRLITNTTQAMSSTSNQLLIKQHLETQQMVRPGFVATGVWGDLTLKDPYIMADHYRMSQPVFGPHPHAGFSAVTYMFDDAQTGFDNRDSRGDSSEIRPGDAHWTVAGAGVVHDEVPIENGKVAHGLQLFINLAAKDKHIPPAAIHILSEDMHRISQTTGARVKVAFGKYDDGEISKHSVVALPTDVSLFDIQMTGSEKFIYPVKQGTNAFLLVVKGSISIGSEAVPENKAVAFGRDGGLLEIDAKTDSHFALFLGAPLDEPIVQHGPFAMTNQADILRAINDYQTGKMGSL
jgi:redox-sensitive bicupin YhaK (pirin superfamily)